MANEGDLLLIIFVLSHVFTTQQQLLFSETEVCWSLSTTVICCCNVQPADSIDASRRRQRQCVMWHLLTNSSAGH